MAGVMDINRLQNDAARLGIVLTDEMTDAFVRHAELLLDWNGRMNLTAITEPREMEIKHFLDSLTVLAAHHAQRGAKVIDVGTGAGFPGIPLKIVRPDLRLTLLDSLGKRVRFLVELSRELGQDNRCIHGRAEELACKPEYREKYDIATARAVASLRTLYEYCLPFLKVGGTFVALKGTGVEEEAREAETAAAILGGRLEDIRRIELPLENRRAIVILKKISQTPTKYPRNAAKIARSPL